ncbi:MAG: outer membrane lipoprotein-sorting protein [Treponema sp.]|jgi:outer membrane lipoprotein-sorting protein|nr:outer membrane lipoprotein-sorting protein [Treponema sp.]
MKKKGLVILAIFLTGGFAAAQDAALIVEQSRNRIKADTVSTRSRMILTTRNGAVTERLMDQYSKKDGQGNNRAIIVFQEPASVRGSRFLTIENQDKDNDQWIFLPSLGRIRRITASEGSGSFMGTDFSYDDISSVDRKADLDNHKLLREERFNNRDCYVIESSPKDTNYQYSKMIQWIDKNNLVPHKVELYDRRGTQVKLLEVLELREVQGRQAIMVTKMTTIAAGTSTSLNVAELKYDDPIPEGVFTTRFLETGRP